MFNFENPNERNTRQSLLRMGLVRVVDDGRATCTTEEGKIILREILEMYADALTRSGYRVDSGVAIDKVWRQVFSLQHRSTDNGNET